MSVHSNADREEYCYSKHERQGCDRAAQNDNSSSKLVELNNQKYISSVFYNLGVAMGRVEHR